MAYGPKIIKDQGGDRQVVGEGGAIVIMAGGTLELQEGAVVLGLAPPEPATAAKPIYSDAYVITADDAAAGAATLPTGLATYTSFFISVMRDDVMVSADAGLTPSPEGLVVTNGTTYVLTEGDVVNWLCTGAPAAAADDA